MAMNQTLNKQVEKEEVPAQERKKGMIDMLNDTAPHDPDSVDLDRVYAESVNYLDQNFAYFLTHVLNMGKPLYTSASETADVSLPQNFKDMEKEFRFRFNPQMARGMTVEENAFVMAHETLHILLKHLSLMKKKQFEEYVLDKDGKPFTVARDGTYGGKEFKKGDKIPTYRKFNIAADCVINDYLFNMGLEPGRLQKCGACQGAGGDCEYCHGEGRFGMFGPDVVNYDCSNSTVTDVWKDIPDQKGGGGGGGSGGGGIPVEGAGADELPASGSGEGFDDHDWMENPGQGQEDAQDKIGEKADKEEGVPDDLKDKTDQEKGKWKGGKNPGSGVGGEENWAEEKGVSLKWVEILKKVVPDIFRSRGKPPKADWSRPRRKLMGVRQMHPDMNLPSVRQQGRDKGDMPSIVMALDTSGSCAHYANRFVTLAKSIPTEKLHLRALTFTTAARELDLDDPKWNSGGTDFGCIERYIQEHIVPDLGHYPKAVVVVTDGAASWGGAQPSKKDNEKWLWMLTDRSYAGYCERGGLDALIDDFVREGKFDQGI